MRVWRHVGFHHPIVRAGCGGGKRDRALTFWLLLGQAKSNIEGQKSFLHAAIFNNIDLIHF